jgi:hypothetical protein
LGLIRYVTYNFSSLDCLLVLYNSLIWSKLEYASVVWNNLSLTDSNKIENIKRIFANLCYFLLFQAYFLRNYNSILNSLNFRTLNSRRRHLDALFLINVFKGKINCPSILDSVGIRVPTRQIREFSTFSVSNALKHSPSAMCVIAANYVCRYLDIFHKNNIYFKDTFPE